MLTVSKLRNYKHIQALIDQEKRSTAVSRFNHHRMPNANEKGRKDSLAAFFVGAIDQKSNDTLAVTPSCFSLLLLDTAL